MVKQRVELCKLGPKKLKNCICKGKKDQKKYIGRWLRGQSILRVQGLGKPDQIQVILKFNTHTDIDAFTAES